MSTTKKLIESLEKRGYTNIHILDNDSTYAPLLEFYKTAPYKIHFLKKNYGYKAFWKSGLWLKFVRSNYVYTDSDIVLNENCPDDFLEYFYKLLKKYPKAHKVGFSLQIDDLPDTFKHKDKVIDWESKFFEKEQEPNVFIAPIDTTFALYRPFSKKGPRDYSILVLRTGKPYQAKHLPWYINSNSLDEEEQYYVNSLKTKTHWSGLK
ncbi:hypothetical protein [Aquimarina agarilytica]|uniref:hypothetical protein n=1 Tax=Aquimarina agarilytica TaxID=1087449 RepID=UPI000289BAB1|nr:hypothetical protein [Aquimarina agarilytica]